MVCDFLAKDVTIYQFKHFRVSGKLCLFTKFRTEIPQTLEPKSVGGFSYLSWLTFGLHELKTDSVCVAHTRTFPQWTSMSVLSFVMLMKFFSSLCLFVCSRTWNSGKSRLLVVKVMLSTFSIRSAAKYNPWYRRSRNSTCYPGLRIYHENGPLLRLSSSNTCNFYFQFITKHFDGSVGTSSVKHKVFLLSRVNQSIAVNHCNSSMEECVGNQLIWSA